MGESSERKGPYRSYRSNIEIRDEVRHDNFLIFGLTAQQVQELLRRGCRPFDFYEQSAELRAVLDLINGGFFDPEHPELFRPLVQSLLGGHQVRTHAAAAPTRPVRCSTSA